MRSKIQTFFVQSQIPFQDSNFLLLSITKLLIVKILTLELINDKNSHNLGELSIKFIFSSNSLRFNHFNHNFKL
jgi:hypothetical protein